MDVLCGIYFRFVSNNQMKMLRYSMAEFIDIKLAVFPKNFNLFFRDSAFCTHNFSAFPKLKIAVENIDIKILISFYSSGVGEFLKGILKVIRKK